MKKIMSKTKTIFSLYMTPLQLIQLTRSISSMPWGNIVLKSNPSESKFSKEIPTGLPHSDFSFKKVWDCNTAWKASCILVAIEYVKSLRLLMEVEIDLPIPCFHSFRIDHK